MSGARPVPMDSGVDCAASDAPGVLFPCCTATRITSANAPAPATTHGRILRSPRGGGGRMGTLAAADAAAAVPQRWQKWAPGVRGAWHDLQVTPSIAPPHSGQNFPADGAPQFGQGMAGVDMAEEDTGSASPFLPNTRWGKSGRS